MKAERAANDESIALTMHLFYRQIAQMLRKEMD